MRSQLSDRLDSATDEPTRKKLKKLFEWLRPAGATSEQQPLNSRRSAAEATHLSARVRRRQLAISVSFALFGVCCLFGAVALLLWLIWWHAAAVDSHSNKIQSSTFRLITRLAYSHTIPSEKLRRSGDTTPLFFGLAEGTTARHELFLADWNNNAVRSFDMHFENLDAKDVYRGESEEKVNDVAYVAESDTLFVATWHNSNNVSIVRSFVRADSSSSSEWTVSDRIQFAPERDQQILLRVLRDGTLFCGQTDGTEIQTCRVQPDRSISNCTRIKLPDKHFGFDVQLVANERRLAAVLWNGSFALFRVDKEPVRVVLLSLVPREDSMFPLFAGDTLLVGTDPTYRRLKRFISFNATKDYIQQGKGGHALVVFDDTIDIQMACFAYNSLIAWDNKSNDLLIYTSN